MSSITAPPAKPWSVAVFEAQRGHMTTFVKSRIIPLLEDLECRRIVVRAPVKSGKREMVEYIAERDECGTPTRVHAFISAWHRKADEEQREELFKQNMAVFSIMNTAALNKCLAWIQSKLGLGLQVVLHLYECDHGSGANQTLSKLWAEVRDNERITNVLYSATPEEVLYSGEVDNEDINGMMGDMLEGHHVRYQPPPGYCGPAKFLEEELVHVAYPFFHKEGGGFVLSSQGKEIVRDLKAAIEVNPRRNVIVLRLSYSDGGNKREHKAIHQFISQCDLFPELAGFDIVADMDDSVDVRGTRVIKSTVEWSNSVYWRRSMPVETPTIIVIDQKSSRSTEWVCHDRVFATHDFRNVARFSTISQAVERVNHYAQKYATQEKPRGEFQRIRVYCHKKTLLLSAGKINYAAYTTNLWSGTKLNRRSTGGAELYTIKSTTEPFALNPAYPNPINKAQRDRALQELECYADISLSARVAGRVEDSIVYQTDFYQVTPETWDNLVHGENSPLNLGGRPITRSFKNPFLLSQTKGIDGGWKGRWPSRNGDDVWQVRQYKDVEVLEKWGHKDIKGDGYDAPQRGICYKDGVLGVAVRFDTGERVTMNSLKAFKSMYGGGARRAFRVRPAPPSVGGGN